MNTLVLNRRDSHRPSGQYHRPPGQTGAELTRGLHRHSRSIAPEGEPEPDVREFARAMDDYKRASGRMFPTWSEVLEVLTGLGYRKQS
jgi:hypothetical protein